MDDVLEIQCDEDSDFILFPRTDTTTQAIAKKRQIANGYSILEMVVQEMLLNAIQAVAETYDDNPTESGRITIQVKLQDDSFEIKVSNTGKTSPGVKFFDNAKGRGWNKEDYYKDFSDSTDPKLHGLTILALLAYDQGDLADFYTGYNADIGKQAYVQTFCVRRERG